MDSTWEFTASYESHQFIYRNVLIIDYTFPCNKDLLGEVQNLKQGTPIDLCYVNLYIGKLYKSKYYHTLENHSVEWN